MTLRVIPISLQIANAFVQRHHRHHDATVGHRFSIDLAHLATSVCFALIKEGVLERLARAEGAPGESTRDSAG